MKKSMQIFSQFRRLLSVPSLKTITSTLIRFRFRFRFHPPVVCVFFIETLSFLIYILFSREMFVCSVSFLFLPLSKNKQMVEGKNLLLRAERKIRLEKKCLSCLRISCVGVGDNVGIGLAKNLFYTNIFSSSIVYSFLNHDLP